MDKYEIIMPETVLICFSVNTKKFKGNYERNVFFRRLYGWKQIINKDDRHYEYKREGLLDEIPNMRVDQSMFVIMKQHLDMMEKFFKEWEDKINWHEFDVLLNKEQQKLLEDWFDD